MGLDFINDDSKGLGRLIFVLATFEICIYKVSGNDLMKNEIVKKRLSLSQVALITPIEYRKLMLSEYKDFLKQANILLRI